MSNYRISPGNKIVKLDSFENEASTEFNFHLISFPFSPPLLHLRIPNLSSSFHLTFVHVSTALGSVKTRELYPLGFFHHRCFLRVPPRNSTWNGTFQSGYPAPGLFIETGGQRFQAFEIDNRWRGRGWPPGVGWKWMKKGNEVTSLEKSYVTRM